VTNIHSAKGADYRQVRGNAESITGRRCLDAVLFDDTIGYDIAFGNRAIWASLYEQRLAHQSSWKS
jgi:hypothetical protein